jgi:hypothetical protein
VYTGKIIRSKGVPHNLIFVLKNDPQIAQIPPIFERDAG